MRSALTRFVALLLALLLCTPAPSLGRWAKADVGYVNMARPCRDGALVVAQTNNPTDSNATPAVGARRYNNTSIPPDDPFTLTPRPPSDYGPSIVGGEPLRTLTITTQLLPLEATIEAGTTLDHRKYGVAILPWAAPLASGSRVVLVYQRAIDGVEVVVADEVINDCFVGGGTSTSIPAASLPLGAVAPGAALSYQLASWPAAGLLQLGNQPLSVGNRWSASDLLTRSLRLESVRPPTVERVQLATWSIVSASMPSDRPTNTFAATSPALSSDGRYLAFESLAGSLVAGDANEANDIFLFDRATATTRRISFGTNGEANDSSTSPAIGGDGRYVAFQSSASNLVANDTNSVGDIFVFDRDTATTSRVSRGVNGGEANGRSSDPSIAGDGRYVAFVSSASNLVMGDTNGVDDIFVFDRDTATTIRVGHNVGETEPNNASSSPAISGDGRYVAFVSSANNLVTGDTNGVDDIFVFDRDTATTTRIGRGSGGEANGPSASPALSNNGALVAFQSRASNLVLSDTNSLEDVFVFARASATLRRVSLGADGRQADGASTSPTVSGDGTVVAFQTDAGNIVPNDANNKSDIVLYALASGEPSRASRGFAQGDSDNNSFAPTLAARGDFVAFESYATNLLAANVVSAGDVYVAQRATATLRIGQVQLFVPLLAR